MKKLLFILFLVAVGYLVNRFILNSLVIPLGIGDQDKTWVQVGNKKIRVLLADTEKGREQGLSERKSLCDDCGLLFVFDQGGIYPFWMRRMYFDIDILWISGDRVVDITYGAKKPSPEEFDNPKIIYQSKVPVDKVLEVNSGWAKENEIKVGDSLRW